MYKIKETHLTDPSGFSCELTEHQVQRVPYR